MGTSILENFIPVDECHHFGSGIYIYSSSGALEGRQGRLCPLFGNIFLPMQGGRCLGEGLTVVSCPERFGKPYLGVEV